MKLSKIGRKRNWINKGKKNCWRNDKIRKQMKGLSFVVGMIVIKHLES